LTAAGLDSLRFALLVTGLGGGTGVDPCDIRDPIAFPVTFADFAALYEKHPAYSDSKIAA
jgi:hypothetical protein